jgi:hypothetical protein
MAVARPPSVDIQSPSNPLENDPVVEVDIRSPSNPLENDKPPEDEAQVDADISNKTFRYNPPIHSANLFAVADLGERATKDQLTRIYDESGAPATYTEKWASKNLGNLRLGRIIQHHMAPGQVALLKHRWGFRFLYNPSSIVYQTNRNDSFFIDPRSETNNTISGLNQDFQTVGLTVLLDRVPDVMSGKLYKSAYSPTLSDRDYEGLRRFGTHWDLEALFKVCNGEWKLLDRGKTSNIGVLMPSNARLVLGGGINHYGFIMSVSYNDLMFSETMVPIRTEVTINFRRHVDMTAEQAEKAFQSGIAISGTGTEEGEDGITNTGPAGSAEGGGSAALASFFLQRVGDTRIIGKAAIGGPSSWHSVRNACIKNVTYAKRYLGDYVKYSGYGTADAVRRKVLSAGQMHSGHDAPAGALYWWGPGVGDGSGHVAVSDGRGNAVNNWGGDRIERLAVKGMAPSSYTGWSSYASI